MDDAQLAARMFPNLPPGPTAAAPTPAATSDDTRAARLFPSASDGISPAAQKPSETAAGQPQQSPQTNPQQAPADVQEQPQKAADAPRPIGDHLAADNPLAEVARGALADTGLSITRAQAERLEVAHRELRAAEITRQSEAWESESRAAFAHSPRDISDAQTAIRQFGSPALTELLNATGLGNHPELIRFARNAARGRR